jgi:hypothetical protein
MKSSRAERNWGIALGVAMGLLLLVSAIFGGGAREEQAGSIDSAAEGGRRGLFLTLKELGFAPVPWVDSPSALPNGPHVLWLSSVPTSRLPGLESVRLPEREDTEPKGGEPNGAEPEDPEQKATEKAVTVEKGSGQGGPVPIGSAQKDVGKNGAERIGLHALEHYKNFVVSGGTLVVPARDDVRHFLVEELGFEACGTIGRDAEIAAGERLARTSTGETLSIDIGHGGAFEALDFNSTARSLWTVADGERELPFVVTVPEGAGTVVLLADDSFLANQSIGKKDHALAAVRLVEELARGGALYLDEYELGAWRPQSVYALAFTPKLVLVTLHLGLLLSLFVWMVAYVRGFPRDPESLELHSPLLRARAQATLLERARRVRLLAAFLRRGVFDQLAARTRLAPVRDSSAIDPATRLADEAHPEIAPTNVSGAAQRSAADQDDRIRQITRSDVERLAAAAGATELAPRLAIVFIERRVRNAADLDRLDLELRSLEREIEGRLGRRARTGVRIPARTESN